MRSDDNEFRGKKVVDLPFTGTESAVPRNGPGDFGKLGLAFAENGLAGEPGHRQARRGRPSWPADLFAQGLEKPTSGEAFARQRNYNLFQENEFSTQVNKLTFFSGNDGGKKFPSCTPPPLFGPPPPPPTPSGRSPAEPIGEKEQRHHPF